MFKKDEKACNILSLEFVFNETRIINWIENNSQEDLLQQKNNEEWIKVSRSIDVLPHPNGVDSIFFHQKPNRFSNFLNAYELGVFKNSDKILGIEWQLIKDYLVLYVLIPENKKKEDRKAVLVVPTFRIYQMQRNKFNGSLDNFETHILKIKDNTAPKYLKEISERYFTGGSLGYENNLCSVFVFPSSFLTNYNL